MVRLKGVLSKVISVHKANFNSSMVRLKEYYTHHVPQLLYHFNSSMVRLKAEAGKHRYTMRSLFQFQYGAIERGRASSLTVMNTVISIPVWCD